MHASHVYQPGNALEGCAAEYNSGKRSSPTAAPASSVILATTSD
jgi:hypothetical protein